MKKLIIFLIFIFLIIYGFFIEPNMLVVNNYKIHDEALKGIKIVFVGDFHIKPKTDERLKRVVELINEQNPDIVLSVGDFVNGHTPEMTMPIEDITAKLKTVKPEIITVLGNHDYWVDRVNIPKRLKESGIKILSNSNIKINIKGKDLYIAGVEDLYTGNPKVYEALDNTKNPVILLTHSPDVFVDLPKRVNLTLAGHVHGGQVRIPFIGAIIVPSEYGNRFSQGLIEENGKKMIVTRGIGTSTLPVRFNCIPEIVVIEFY